MSLSMHGNVFIEGREGVRGQSIVSWSEGPFDSGWLSELDGLCEYGPCPHVVDTGFVVRRLRAA